MHGPRLHPPSLAGGADSLSVAADVALLQQQLPPGVVVAHHHEPSYAHLDWELGSEAPSTVFPQVVALAVHFMPLPAAAAAPAAACTARHA